jgi:hypothetical protein
LAGFRGVAHRGDIGHRASTSWSDQILFSVTSVAQSATTVLEALLIAAAALAVGALFSGRAKDRRNPRVVLGRFGDGPAGSGYGAAVLRDIQVAVRRLEGGAFVRSELATAGSGDLALPPAAITALPQGTVVAALLALLDLLYPSRDLRLDGCLQPDNGEGVGIWLRLSNRKRSITRIVSLRHDTYAPRVGAPAAGEPKPDPYGPYAPLVTPAAIWLAYQINERLRG